MRILILFAFLVFAAFARAQDAEGLLRRGRELLAPIAGKVKLAGLKAPVEVLRDAWGVPHIYAKNQDDLFFAQGFVAAQDRLFQIEMWRRHAAGELAEVLGEPALESDRFARLIRYRGDMEAEWRSYAPDTKAIATAFTAGINACIDQFGDKLPIEFELLKFRPKRWRPEDVLGRMSGIYMSQNFKTEMMRAKLVAAVGIDKARKLAPVDPPRAYDTPVPLKDVAELDDVLKGFRAAIKMLEVEPPKTESNNWAISGKLSGSGKPLLASDPHRAIALPSLRYLVHLNAPGWNVIGAGEPAIPGVGLGHNERIAWGITIVGIDQADIYVEETHPDDPRQYKADGKWVMMEEETDSIRVKGRAHAAKATLRYTRHGPVLYQNEKSRRAYALKWIGHEPGGAAYLGGIALARAKDKASFLEALPSWKIPGLNFMYADVDGNIGWVAHSGTPRRLRDGLLPQFGDGAEAWKGQLTVAEEPQSWNPKSGWLATANHNILPKGYDHLLGFEFAPPYRFERIKHALETKKTWTLAEFGALQHDDVSLPAQALIRMLREDKAIRGLTPPGSPVDVLMKWDGKLAVDAEAGPLFALWLRELQNEFYGRHVAKGLRDDLISLSGLPVMLKALESHDPFWLGDAKTSRTELFRATLDRASAALAKLPKKKQARWGALHTAELRHPLSTLGKEHAKAFNRGPVERGGDAQTPFNTRYDASFRQIHGASYRQLFDLADWDRGLATSVPGQSGQPGSPHYDDLLAGWAAGEYFPLVFSRGRVEEAAKNRLWLMP